MDIVIVISQMLKLFMILALGYISVKTKITTQEFGSQLSRFILNITLPFLMIASVAAMPRDTDKKDILLMILIAVLFYIIMPFVAYLITRLLGVKKEERNMFMFMTIFSNIGFMGYPLIASIFGDGAIFYATIFNLVFNLSVFSFGIILMSSEGKKALTLKNFLSPGMIGSLVAIAMFAANIQLPDIINSTLKTVGDTTTPLAMITIGISLAGISMRSVFTEFRLYPYIMIKQVLLPIAAWLILKNIIESPYLLGIVIIIVAMPVGASAVLFANRYGNNVSLATKGVFITTLASIITIPIILYLIL